MSGKREADLVVVGAGAAGLAAAAAAQAGGLDVVLLEAKDRIGGRALTDAASLPSGPFDIGCHWLHDASENPFAAIALATGRRIRNTVHPGRMPRWLAVGGDIKGEAERAAAADYNAAAFAAFAEAGAAGRDVAGATVLDASSPWYPIFRGWCSALMGVPPERLSTADYAANRDTGENWPVCDGYGALVAAAFADVPARLSTPVAKIDGTGARMRVETAADGAIEAEDVILTVSTTVLASGAIEIAPGLPADLEAAIEACPLGHAERIGVALRRKIDGIPDQTAGHLFTKAGDQIGIMIHEFGRPELTGYLSGDLAKALGAAGEKAVFAVFRDALKEAFGADFENEIAAWTCSQWTGDPHIQGAYSAARPGEAHRRPRLREPAQERLFLAGEATHPERFASAHGAYMSGLRAVGQVRARRKRAGLE
ncbi:MAG: NAD(P)/FAD-dependent oxidoreductase [Marivibrio sp.]|uniref:flavin monoamine oxidase family protein n=1 Tax=Marivibrio sp. TaxID=2039719 RepID=UPI0032EF5DF1